MNFNSTLKATLMGKMPVIRRNHCKKHGTYFGSQCYYCVTNKEPTEQLTIEDQKDDDNLIDKMSEKCDT